MQTKLYSLTSFRLKSLSDEVEDASHMREQIEEIE